MKDPKPPAAEPTPGRYGAGYGEGNPAATPQPLVNTIGSGTTAPAGLEPIDRKLDPDAPPPVAGDDGTAVVFTPADVQVRPPDRTPTESAPESEKAGLLFERS